MAPANNDDIPPMSAVSELSHYDYDTHRWGATPSEPYSETFLDLNQSEPSLPPANAYSSPTPPPINAYSSPTLPPTNAFSSPTLPPTNAYSSPALPPTNSQSSPTLPASDLRSEPTSNYSEPRSTVHSPPSLTLEEAERREKLADTAPTAWFQSDPQNAPIFVPQELGKHVNHYGAESGPQNADTVSPMYAMPHQQFPSPPTTTGSPSKGARSDWSIEPTGEATICGLRKRTFWILTLLSLIIMAAGIGGGIGGGLAKMKSNDDGAAAAAATTTSASPTSSKAKASPKPSASPDRPNQNFQAQVWEFANLTGRSQIFYTTGYFRFPFNAEAYRWKPGAYNDTMYACSIAMCKGSTEIGWYGSGNHLGTADKWKPLLNIDYGDNLHIQCAMTWGDPECPPAGFPANSFISVQAFETSNALPTTLQTSVSASKGTDTVSAVTTGSESRGSAVQRSSPPTPTAAKAVDSVHGLKT